jgi:biopolymer transport protein ExbB
MNVCRLLTFALAALLLAMPLSKGGAQPANSPPQPVQSTTPQAPSMPAQVPAGVPAAGEVAQPAASVARALPEAPRMRELSPWSMFMSADIVVKAVMLSLAFASLVTWTVFLAKSLQIYVAQRRLRAGVASIGTARSLSEAQMSLGQRRGLLNELIAAAIREIRLSADNPVKAGIQERVTSYFVEMKRTEARAIRQGMGVLATIGSTAPFVGLFGTVWGIMNSFIGISKAQTTNLAVVAPGIAEALLATAIGLVAAIPAVIFYNHFARGSKGYLELVSRASGAVGRLLSRDLDSSNSGMLSRAAE